MYSFCAEAEVTKHLHRIPYWMSMCQSVSTCIWEGGESCVTCCTFSAMLGSFDKKWAAEENRRACQHLFSLARCMVAGRRALWWVGGLAMGTTSSPGRGIRD